MVVYVVEIPQSGTAHQASDKRYYKRYNFESVAMEDYEIRDIMSRVKHPIVELDFLIVRRVLFEKDGLKLPADQPWVESFLKVAIKNTGKVYANYVNYYLELPEVILSDADDLNDSEPGKDTKCIMEKILYGTSSMQK